MSIQNITPKYQLNILEAFKEYLRQLQYDAELTETAIGDGRVYSTLYVLLNISSDQLPGENYLRLETAFLPKAEKESSEQSVLQTLVPIVMAQEQVDLNEIFGLIIKLNTFLPIGSFGYWEEQNMIYYKQNNIISDKGSEHLHGTFEEQLAMMQHLLTNFVPSIAAVAIDGIPTQVALQQNPFAQAFL